MELKELQDKLYPFRSQFIELKSGRMHYLDEGEGEVLIALHGNPTWSFYYRNVIVGLKDKYRVIAPDHIGCGLSEKKEDYVYTLRQRIDDINELVEKLGIKRYSLLVHDWGGAIGFGHAVENEEKLEKVIILNTAAFRMDFIPRSIWLCKIPVIGPFIVKYLNAFCYPATFMTTVRPLSSDIKKGYLFPFEKIKNRKAVVEFVQDIPMKSSHKSYETLKNIEEKLENIKSQKLILWGGKDFCFNDLFFKKWRTIYPDAKNIYFEDAGHYVLEDKTQECVTHIREFLNGN